MASRLSASRRWLALPAGIYLTGLPTYYAIATVGLTGKSAAHVRHIGVVLFVVWVAIALYAGYVALSGDLEILGLLRRRRHLLVDERQRDSGMRAIRLMLLGRDDSKAGLLRSLKPKVYVADDVDQPTELVPLLDDDPPRYDRWPLNEGVVGLAFTDNDPENPLVITGGDLAAATQALTNPEQRTQFADLRMVAAIVIRDIAGRRVGVLSCSSNAARPSFGTERREALKVLAADLGIMLRLVR